MDCPYCKRKIPNKIRVFKDMRSDLAGIIPGNTGVFVSAGIHEATFNPQGAISVIGIDGKLFGIKPGEFEFVYDDEPE